ncbi:MAG TPA: hypothetical protein VGL78_12075 [Solirubrobacteraceae bacterium]
MARSFEEADRDLGGGATAQSKNHWRFMPREAPCAAGLFIALSAASLTVAGRFTINARLASAFLL